jgi:hypothetical protein
MPLHQLVTLGVLLCCCGRTGVGAQSVLSQVQTVAGNGQGSIDGIGTEAKFNRPGQLGVTSGTRPTCNTRLRWLCDAAV